MHFRKSLLLVGILTLVLTTLGCSKEAPPNLDPQKKVVHTYFEGMRDHNKDKIFQTVDVSIPTKAMDPDFKNAFAKLDETMGKINSWVIVDKGSWMDEVNGQSLIKVKLSTTKKKVLPLDIDLRKDGNRWVVYTVQVSDSGKMDSSKAAKNNPHNKTDTINKSDKTKSDSPENTDKSKNQ